MLLYLFWNKNRRFDRYPILCVHHQCEYILTPGENNLYQTYYVKVSSLGSLVKLYYFKFAFLENCTYKKQKKSIKDQRKFCSNIFFKVLDNFMSLWENFMNFYEQNDINFFIPSVDGEIEGSLYLTTTMECNIFQIWILFPLAIIKVSIYGN